MISSTCWPARDIPRRRCAKDLSYFGSFGRRGLGYNVEHLRTEIRAILGPRPPLEGRARRRRHRRGAARVPRLRRQSFDVGRVRLEPGAHRTEARRPRRAGHREAARVRGCRDGRHRDARARGAGSRGHARRRRRARHPQLRAAQAARARGRHAAQRGHDDGVREPSFVLSQTRARRAGAPERRLRATKARRSPPWSPPRCCGAGRSSAIRDTVSTVNPRRSCACASASPRSCSGCSSCCAAASADARSRRGTVHRLPHARRLLVPGRRAAPRPRAVQAFLTCAGTLMAALFAWPLIGQRLSRELVAGLALAFAGSALLSLRDGRRSAAARSSRSSARPSTRCRSSRSRSSRRPPTRSRSRSGSRSSWPACSCRSRATRCRRSARSTAPRGRFAYLADRGQHARAAVQVWAQSVLSAGRIALLFALEPVFALVFALTLGAERFATRWWIGALLILSAVVIVEWRAATSTRPPANS